MLAMMTCRRWILLVVTGSLICGILAVPNTGDSVNSTSTNARIYPPGDKEVPGVVPLPSSQSTNEEIPTTTIAGDSAKYPSVSLGESKKLSTPGKNDHDAKYSKDHTPLSSIEALPPAKATKSSDASKETSRMAPGSFEIAGKVNAETTESTEAAGRSLHGNDLAVPGYGKMDTRNSLHGNITDLSDVSMDDDDKEIEGGEYLSSKNMSGVSVMAPALATVRTRCTYGNKTYEAGAQVRRDCEDLCVCGKNGHLADCRPLCTAPFFRAGRGIKDALCQEKLTPDEPCCATLVCAEDSEPEPEELCHLGNRTVARGESIEDGCSQVCVCEARGNLKCRPRCSPSNSTSTSMATSSGNLQGDKCVYVPDPRDSCCIITLCDVTLGDVDQFKPDFIPTEGHANLTEAEALNSTAIKLVFSNNLPLEHIMIELSTDNLLWAERKLNKDGIVGNLEPSRTYSVRVVDEAGHRPGTTVRVVLPAESSSGTAPTSTMVNNSNETNVSQLCYHRGKSYKVGAEWYDECISFCSCSMVDSKPKTECATIECPTDFGLDVLDANCLEWEWVPADFVPVPPRCCSQEVRCRNNGSCLYEGNMYNNWSEIPVNVTGCDKRCYCELGNVSCQQICPPVPALPPSDLQCPPSLRASLQHLPEDECCKHWACGDPSTASFPPNIGNRNGTATYPGPLATDSINQLQSIDDRKKTPGISGSGDMQPWVKYADYATIPRPKYHESSDLDSSNRPDVTDDHEPIHYPMDPGYPTTTRLPPPPPYHGPYDPNFRPTQPSVDEVFRLNPPRTNAKTDPPVQASKDGPKPKTESKKPIEPVKPTKDTAAAAGVPLAPGIITEKQNNPSRHFVEPYYRAPPPPYAKNYSTLTQQPLQHAYKNFPTKENGGERVVPQYSFHREFDSSVPRPVQYKDTSPGPGTIPTTGLEGPNAIFTNDHQNNNLASREQPTIFNRGNEQNPQRAPPPPLVQVYQGNSRPNPLPAPNRPVQGPGVGPNEHDLPEELYRLINLQHPGLIRLNEDPPEGHQGLYSAIQPSGVGAKKHEGTGHGIGMQHLGSLQYFNPQIFAETGGDNYGETYHVHGGPGIPGGTRQQIEELLLHVGEKDPNNGPFQHYPAPGQDPTAHKQPPRVTVPQVPQNSGQLTRLNHPFAGTGMIHDIHSYPGPGHGLPPGFPIHTVQGEPSPDQITVQMLEAITADRVRLVFTVPRVLVGLHGRVEVRYTSEKSNLDPATWKSQTFAPPDDLIATSQLEFELGGLTPFTEYKVIVTVKLRDLANSPSSKILSVTTLESPNTDVATLPPQIPTNAELTVTEANSTWANIAWRKFTEYELDFIDGVQLRYKETQGKVYAATPLIHRAVTSYLIENLKPAVTYEVGIYFIPFPGQTTELVSENLINFTTSAEPDPYSFDIKVEIKGIKPTEVEVAWKGVPYPEDKYVNIYRAIYQSDTGKEDTSTFKIAKRDSPARTLIGELKPGTRYRLWIEVYLTNGRIKKSNVQDFVTKPGVPTSAGVLQQGKLAAQVPLHEGDYYGPLVIVAIVASLAILSTLILLMMLMKRRTSSKADISPRKTTSAYDNPSYKTCEDVPTITSCNGQKMESITSTVCNEQNHSKRSA